MFINTTKNIRIISDNGTKFEARAGWIGEIPKWAEEHWYFKALCKDGSVTAIVRSPVVGQPLNGPAVGDPPVTIQPIAPKQPVKTASKAKQTPVAVEIEAAENKGVQAEH